jgi:hypothetical protein
MSNVPLPTYALQGVQVWFKPFGNEEFFIPISPRIANGWLKRHIWHSLPLRNKECLFGHSQSVMKTTLFLRQKHFLVHILSPTIVARPKPHTKHCLLTLYKQCKFHWVPLVIKSTLLWRSKSFRPYLALNCNRLNGMSYLALPAPVPKAVQVCSK